MSQLKGSILITGANGALGRGFTSKLIKSSYGQDYRGVYIVRNPSTANDLNHLLSQAPKSHTSEVLALDLDSLESIRHFADDINQRVANGTLEPIRALILNAAFQEANSEALTPKTFSKDGYEAAFAINYLANFLLVLLLLQSIDKGHGRIVFMSSWGHDPYDKRNDGLSVFAGEEYKTLFKDTETLSKGVEYTDDGFKAGMRRYGASKLLLVMFMYSLQRRLDFSSTLSNISLLSLDPGSMGGSKLARKAPLMIRILAYWILPVLQDIWVWLSPNGILRSPSKSGGDLLRACFDEETLGAHPKALFLNGSDKSNSSKESHDEAKQEELWEGSLRLARVRDGETIFGDWR